MPAGRFKAYNPRTSDAISMSVRRLDVDPTLRAIIDAATIHRLREVLIAICTESTAGRDIVSKKLVLGEEDSTDYTKSSEEEDEDKDEDDEEDEGEDENAIPEALRQERLRLKKEVQELRHEAQLQKERLQAAKPQKKRPRPRYAICEHCNEEFDVTFNEPEDCMWHDGTGQQLQIRSNAC